MTYDPRCYDLADTFLEDHPHLHSDAHCGAMAVLIQQTIEDYIADLERNYEPPDPPGFEGGFAPNH